jgi:hypothetical protein
MVRLLSFLLLLLLPNLIRAQAAPSSPGSGPKNLQVLPANLTLPEVQRIMGQWSVALGMNCMSCHKSLAAPHLDETELKQKAREMVRLQEKVNQELVAMKLAPSMSCMTCHRGRPKVPGSPTETGGMLRVGGVQIAPAR